MNKIGILTFHRAINYGALFQALALMESLKQAGGDAEVIDYRSLTIEKSYRITWGWNKRSVKGWVRWIIGVPHTMRKKKRFKKYRINNLNMTPQKYSVKTISHCQNRFDKIIAGSDQVWNMQISNDDTVYFLDFVDSSSKKYSYAISVGNYTINNEDYVEFIKSFNTRSLREDDAKRYIEEITKQGCRTDIDPVLLLTGKDWKKRITFTKHMEEPYIFIYSVHPQNNMVEYAYELAEKNNCKIYYLHNRTNTALCRLKNVKVMFDCSPSDFLGYIYHAHYVITNSFHGTVFSILYHKQFVAETLTLGGFNNRVFSLLYQLGLGERILENKTELFGDLDIDKKIDWNSVEKKLQNMRQPSLEYIKKIAIEP